MSPEALDQIVEIIRNGGVICFPTDTAYGLGVDPGNGAAVDRLFRLKGRAPGKPILLLVDSMEMAGRVSRPHPDFHRVAGRFWPGPITIIVPAHPGVSRRITAGSDTIGLRWPEAEFPLRLLSRLGRPITATSANQSGRPVAGTVDEALDQLGSGLDAVIDAGPRPAAAMSTILDLTTDPPRLLREGPVSYDALSEFLDGELARHPA